MTKDIPKRSEDRGSGDDKEHSKGGIRVTEMAKDIPKRGIPNMG